MTADLLRLLDELDAAREKATPGEWWSEHHDYGDEWWFGGTTGDGQEVINGHIVTGGDSAADAALIVAAVNALPKLTAALRAVLAECDDWAEWANADLRSTLARSVVADIRRHIADALTPEDAP